MGSCSYTPFVGGGGGHTLSLVYLHIAFLYILFSNLQEIPWSLTRASPCSNTWSVELLTSWSTSMVWLLSDRIYISDGRISAHAVLSCKCSLHSSSVASTRCAVWWTHKIRSQIGSCKHNHFIWILFPFPAVGHSWISQVCLFLLFQLCLYLLAVVGKMLLVWISSFMTKTLTVFSVTVQSTMLV